MAPFVFLLLFIYMEVVNQQRDEDHWDQDVQIKRYPCVVRCVVCFDHYTPDVHHGISQVPNGEPEGKIRVYEMTDHPIARAMLGYLLVRGGVHQVAYAKALEELTGANVTKMLNIPNISNDKFPETRQYTEQGTHRTLYRFSPDDFKDIDKVWKGPHPEDGQEVFVQDGPPEGGQAVDHPEEPSVYAPGYDPGELAEIAQHMMRGS